MVYISSDGRVLQAKPWGLSTITDFFWGAITFLQLFFTTLISPDANKKGEGYTTDYRAPGRGGGPPGNNTRISLVRSTNALFSLVRRTQEEDGRLWRRSGRSSLASSGRQGRMRLMRSLIPDQEHVTSPPCL